MSKYSMLLDILDTIRNEAPKNYHKYYPPINEIEKLNHARSLAYIHLYLKASFDISEFNTREDFITDGPNDGGIDAYYIDSNNKKIYFIQSKFRTTENNFEQKQISIEDILKMDTIRITDGEEIDEYGNSYNSKILNMIKAFQNIEDIARYRYEVILLANLSQKLNESDRIKLTGLPTKVFDFQKCYTKLLFPVLVGHCHQAEEIKINLSLEGKEHSGKFENAIQTKYALYNVMLVFIPTLEIGKVMSTYKNSILTYNPRSYLGYIENSVNQKIADTLIKKETNEFALFNNGITILSDETEYSSKTGKKNRGQLILSNPQIINGGQTANTLSQLYQQHGPHELFNDKEVLVKIITLDNESDIAPETRLELIEELSKATNQQSVITEADRRANDKIQIIFQKNIFNEFGYCYNRKEGEFYHGLQNNYLQREKIIDRSDFMRIATSIKSSPSNARRSGKDMLFKEESFNKVFNDENEYKRFMYGYFSYSYLKSLEKKFKKTNDRYGIKTYGNVLRYGKYALVKIVDKTFSYDIDIDNYMYIAEENTKLILSKWIEFEQQIINNISNSDYFIREMDNNGNEIIEYNFDNYYKGKTLDKDLENFNFI